MNIRNPVIQLFTTFILCSMLVTPFIQNIYEYTDLFVEIVYWSVAVYVFIKKIYDIYSNRTR